MVLSIAAAIVACGGGGGGSADVAASPPPAGGGGGGTPTPGPSPSPSPNPSPSPSPGPTQPSPVGFCTGAPTTPVNAALPPVAAGAANPIMFVTHPPQADAFASRMSPFANHLSANSVDKGTIRGGDLMIRYPDGVVRNLTTEAGLSSIAVREPTVHWNGDKAVFSMVFGSGAWQMYEVSGLAKGQTASICKLRGQPGYNNVSPIYTADDQVIFSSDTPRAAHLYPMLDEYETTVTVSGFFKLDPAAGSYRKLNATPSGAFTPTVDSFGRVIFTRWDHLVQDQQSEDNGGNYQAFNLASEAAGAAKQARSEVFPEKRFANTNSPYGTVSLHQFNLFQPWQMNQDGTAELTLNHIGRHELRASDLRATFLNDSALSSFPNLVFSKNQFSIGNDSGFFGIKEDPRSPGSYYSVYAAEFASFTAGPIIQFNAAPGVNTEQIVLTQVTGSGGRFRNVLPLTTGAMLAAYSANGQINQNAGFRITVLNRDAAGIVTVGSPITSGIVKNGVTMWELEPSEVVARARPGGKINDGLDTAAKQILAEEGVAEADLTAWLRTNNLALIVTNNQTKRDRADTQQPQNLEVPGGAKTTANNGKMYPISHFQIIEGQQVRGYDAFNGSVPGRRVIGQFAAQNKNPANPGGPAGSVKIAADGSTAAFVQANRALAWQTTDAGGVPIVRERVWVTFQPGEARTCAGCHGSNTKTQDGLDSPINKPEALRELLRYWKVNK
jgi:hypothetical protein